jgi:hypothetical protein
MLHGGGLIRSSLPADAETRCKIPDKVIARIDADVDTYELAELTENTRPIWLVIGGSPNALLEDRKYIGREC